MVLVEETGLGSLRSREQSEDKNIKEMMLSKLNPLATEFVPPSRTATCFQHPRTSTRPRINRDANHTSLTADRQQVKMRTVFVSHVDHQVTEQQLASLFIHCGQVVDCRICGDPNSVLRFAFIEFTHQDGARAALSLSGTMLGFYPLKVRPSKTAIAPVNPTFLPQSQTELQMCARTVYCTNIDNKISEADLKLFFESVCGQVYRLRLLGDHRHSTCIAFIEFVLFLFPCYVVVCTCCKFDNHINVTAESATAALNCSGVVLGSLALRVSPSKTPIRPRAQN